MSKNYCVYKHTVPNGKVYIGISGQDPLKRWANGHGYRRNIIFFNDIILYGWLNIEHEILFDGLTQDEACEKEIELIAQYNSTDCKYGYNQIDGMHGYMRPDNVRDKIKTSMKKCGVEQYTLDGQYIKSYESMREASRQTGIHQGNIANNCKGSAHTAGGFIWRYTSQDESEI